MRWIAPPEKDAGTATLEKPWSAADERRANSGLKAAEYSQPVLGLIFLRFADARFAQRRAELEKGTSGRRGSRVDDVGAYHSAGVTHPGTELSAAERDEVKKVAGQLLGRLQGILTTDWIKTAQSRARVRDAIEEALDDALPRAYTPHVFKQKAGVLFQHICEPMGRAA